MARSLFRLTIMGSTRSSMSKLALLPENLVKNAPKPIRPYLEIMRVQSPTGVWLLYWPCTWSIALASPAGSLPSFQLLALFAAGSFFMRSAGCVVNDILDKDFDKMVKRTASRPLASSKMSVKEAICLLSGLLSVSLGILLQLNWLSVAIGASSLILVAAYPLAKRYTYWPQLLLGMTFNWGTILGWSAVNEEFNLQIVLPLYLSAINWTLIYDTIYAHQDKEDDMLIGVKSTALLFGESTRYYLSCFGAAFAGGLTLTGVLVDQTWPYFVAIFLTSSQIAWQIFTFNMNSAEDCWKKFSSNRWLGFILFCGIVVGNLLKEEKCQHINEIQPKKE